jgi:microcystin-dependent protein
MASVTGITAERANEIWSASVVSGKVTDTGQLLLTTRGGTILDGGSVINPYLNKSWPVGAIFLSISATNPASTLGVGEWSAWGTGRVPVGIDPNQSEFNTVEKTGGIKAVQLSWAQSGLRDHAHGISLTTSGSGVDAQMSSASASTNPAGGAAVARGDGANAGLRTINSSGHSHTVNGGTAGVGNFDALEAHQNLQPYITCYMWKRTA